MYCERDIIYIKESELCGFVKMLKWLYICFILKKLYGFDYYVLVSYVYYCNEILVEFILKFGSIRI